MQKRYTPIELLIGNTTVNVFVHHSSLPSQTISKWELLKHEDCLQPLLSEITALGIGGILTSLVIIRHCELSLKADYKFTRGGPFPSIKKCLK